MKKLIYLSLFILSLTACKKLTVKEEKEFVEINVPGSSSNSLYNAGMSVTLMPGDVADILPGGDVVERGTYKIKGKKLTVKAGKEYEFRIISETEIRYGERILELK